MSNLNEFVVNFIKTVCEEKDIDYEIFAAAWKDPENQGNFMELLKHMEPKKSKKPKIEGAPKRPLNAYMFYCAGERKNIVKSMMTDRKILKIKKGKNGEPDEEYVPAVDISRKMGEKWKELKSSDSQKSKKLVEKYEKQAADDKERYDKAMKEFSPPPEDEDDDDDDADSTKKDSTKQVKKTKTKKTKTKKENNGVKKPTTAYNFFLKDQTGKAKEQLIKEKEGDEGDDEKVTHAEVRARLSEMWNAMKEDKTKEYKKYEKMASN
jgi:hypothetical protein